MNDNLWAGSPSNHNTRPLSGFHGLVGLQTGCQRQRGPRNPPSPTMTRFIAPTDAACTSIHRAALRRGTSGHLNASDIPLGIDIKQREGAGSRSCRTTRPRRPIVRTFLQSSQPLDMGKYVASVMLCSSRIHPARGSPVMNVWFPPPSFDCPGLMVRTHNPTRAQGLASVLVPDSTTSGRD